MDIKNKTIWQHAAGDWGHSHEDLCLKYDVILTGETRSITIFKDKMQEGDIVVLKLGRSTVCGVGVTGQYEHFEVFDDIDGWWLGHTRRVQWLWREKPYNFQGLPLVVATTARLYNTDVIQWLGDLGLTVDEHEYKHADLPDLGDKVTSDAIATYLFNKGIASDSIRNLLDPNGGFLQIAKWYDEWEWNDRPSEHETVSHLVVPLLRILGWTPQRMALEWNRIDVALFSRLPRNDNDLAVVLEAKKVREPCLSWAKEQAMEYVKKHSLANCLRVIVTDGLRYGVFTRNQNGEFNLYAYLNLRNLRTNYAIYDCYAIDGCKGAKEAIFAMTPEWQPDQ